MSGPASIRRPDVCIVGLGAAGGIAAHVLTEAGLDVVGLEAGPHWTNADFPPDELTMYNRRNTLGAKFNAELQTESHRRQVVGLSQSRMQGNCSMLASIVVLGDPGCTGSAV